MNGGPCAHRGRRHSWGWEKTGLPMAAAFADLLVQGDNPG